MVFGFFKKKKPGHKLSAKQDVEIEFSTEEGTESFFTTVLEVDKKKFTLKTPVKETRPYQYRVGDKVTIVYMIGNTVYSFTTKILEKREKEIDLDLPDDISEMKCPYTEADFVIDVPVPVEYRAISTAHLQTATTKEINSRGIKIVTNLPIPKETVLHIELEIPDSPIIKAKGRVIGSQKLSPEDKRSIADIEFEDVGAKEKETVFRYTILYQQRRNRKQYSS